jgi:O-antigen/teichoic acid export membrane protein
VSDQRTLVSGTVQNVAGLAAGVVAAYGVQILIGRAVGPAGLGLVTVAVQVAFVAAAGSRFGMDLAAVREVAVGAGAHRSASLRALVDRCALVATSVSAAVAVLTVAASPLTGGNQRTIAIAAGSIPFAAAANTYLGATRGLKRMSPTLWVYWIGQPLGWIALAAGVLAAGGGAEAVIWTYDLSWVAAAISARAMWRRCSAGLGDERPEPGRLAAALRFGAPRAPSALLAQALFWADLWVLDAYAGPGELGTYAAVGRLSQVILLFLTSLNLLFSPFAADLHARGERSRLDVLFKDATRWSLAATLPVAIILAVAPAAALHAFGGGFESGTTALRILVAGQLANVATGSVGFVLIMIGRTGIDLLDNALGVAVLVGLAAPLSSAYGMEGAAVASAVTIAAVNGLRLVQVKKAAGIQPYARTYLPLALPAAACAGAAVVAHLAAGGGRWWVDLAATSLAGGVAYGASLPWGLPAAERLALQRVTRRITNRASR